MKKTKEILFVVIDRHDDQHSSWLLNGFNKTCHDSLESAIGEMSSILHQDANDNFDQEAILEDLEDNGLNVSEHNGKGIKIVMGEVISVDSFNGRTIVVDLFEGKRLTKKEKKIQDAAPELLEALKLLKNTAQSTTKDLIAWDGAAELDEAIDIAEKLIKKATE